MLTLSKISSWESTAWSSKGFLSGTRESLVDHLTGQVWSYNLGALGGSSPTTSTNSSWLKKDFVDLASSALDHKCTIFFQIQLEKGAWVVPVAPWVICFSMGDLGNGQQPDCGAAILVDEGTRLEESFFSWTSLPNSPRQPVSTSTSDEEKAKNTFW